MIKRIISLATAMLVAQQAIAAPAYFLTVPLRASASGIAPEEPVIPAPAPISKLSASVSALAFPTVQTGVSLAPLAVVLTNTGDLPVAVKSIVLTGADAAEFEFQAPCNSLAVGASCTAYVYLKGSSASNLSAELALTYKPESTGPDLIIPITASVIAPSGMLEGSGDFGNVPVGSAVDKVIKIKNTGIGRLALGTGVVTGTGFSLAASDCPASLAVGAACSTTLRMEGIEAKTQTGLYSIAAGGSTLSLSLSGVGQQSNISFTSGTLSRFGQVNVGNSAISASVTVKNTGNIAASGLSVTTTEPLFTLVDSTCLTNLAPNASCTFKVAFTPESAGSVASELLVSTGSEIQARMPLSGVGSSSTVLIASSNTDFQGVMGANKTFYYAITNSGSQPIKLLNLDLQHASSQVVVEPKSGSSNCGVTLAANATCRYNFNLNANDAVRSGLMIMTVETDSGTYVNDTITGYVSWAKLVPTPANPSAALGSVTVGQFADSSVISIYNSAQHIAVAALTYNAPAGFEIINNTCGDQRQRQTTCSLQIRFAPKTAGSFTGAVNITATTETAGATPYTLSIPVSGSAVAPSELQWTGGAYDLVEVDSKRSNAYSLYNTGTGTLNLSGLMVTGNSEFVLTRSTCGATLAPKTLCEAIVTFNPIAAGDRPSANLAITANGTVISKVITASAGVAAFTPSRASLVYSTVYRAGAGISNGFTGITMTVKNTGTAAAEDFNASIVYDQGSPIGTFYFNNSACVNRLNAGATCSTNVRAQSSVTGVITGKAVFQSSSARVDVPFSTTFVAPEVMITEVTPVASTAVGKGSTSAYAAIMDSTRTGDLLVSVPKITGNTSEFSIASGTTCNGSYLNRTARCEVKVLFTPTDVGERPPATLEMSIGAIKRTFPLVGTGT